MIWQIRETCLVWGGGFPWGVVHIKQGTQNSNAIASIENLLLAWGEFVRGKRKKKDVQEFSLRLMENIVMLHDDIKTRVYKHGSYQVFNICDPKPRIIHKATVRDRLLHHAVYRILYPIFHPLFIADSFSCQKNKGTHKALNRFRSFAYTVSNNHTRTCWVLKCDIKKFFASIDHDILKTILRRYIADDEVLWLLGEIIDSHHSGCVGKGLPLGNITSQLFCNIYMNEFDQFVKHTLKIKHYIRYADDFVLLSRNKAWLEQQIPRVQAFLKNKLNLTFHPNKVFIKTIASGVDFLGWVHFPDHRVLRRATRRRMVRNLARSPRLESIASYRGLLGHGNTRKLQQSIEVRLR